MDDDALTHCLALPIRTDAEVGARHRPALAMLLDLLTTLASTLPTFQAPDPSGEPATGLRGWFDGLRTLTRIVVVLVLAAAAHFVVRGIRRVGEWVLTPADSPRLAHEFLAKRRPKVATLTGLTVSTLTFVIYFTALGFALGELTPLTLGQYLASATVIGLAVGFGTQGLVQDVVTGLTLIFSDSMDIGDLMEISGQIGRVERIGLRFTTISNFVGQTVVIPNRNIGVLGRYRTGYARAYVDVQLPDGVDEETAHRAVEDVARGARAQHSSVIVAEPRIHAVQRAGDAGWSYLRTRFRIWPGQQGLIENAVRQRMIAAMKQLDPNYTDWMVTVTYRIPTR